MSINCNCGEPQFSAPGDQAPVVARQRQVNDLVHEHALNLDGILNSCNCGRRLSPPRLHLRICATRTPGKSTTKYEQRQWNRYDLLNSLDHRGQDVDDQRRNATAEPQFSPLSDQGPVVCTPTGMSTTNPELHCRIRVFCTVCTARTGEKTTGKQQPCPRTAPVKRTTGI